MNKFLPSEIAWVAGLFEGEGSTGVYSKHPVWKIGLHPRDTDVINRVKEILQCGNIHGPYVRPDGSSVLCFTVGKIKDVYKVIQLTYPYLGARRQKQCDIVIEYIKETKTFQKEKLS